MRVGRKRGTDLLWVVAALKQPRFIVREITGYPIATGGGVPRRASTEVMVLDRGYCHRVVWSSSTTAQPTTYKDWFRGRLRIRSHMSTARQWPLDGRREYAAELAARLNAEDVAA